MVANFPRALTSALLLTSLGALAQTAPESGRPDPLDPKASVPPLVYRSSLPMVQAARADKSLTWREANENVARIGGWRAYAREAQAAPPSPPTPAAPASTPAGAVKPAGKSLPAAPGHAGQKSP